MNSIKNFTDLHRGKNLIFNSNPNRQQSFQPQPDQTQRNEPVISKILNFFTNFNLCLRPEFESKQLTTFLENYQVDSLYQDPYYGECYALKSKELDNIKEKRGSIRNIFSLIQQKQYFQRVASLWNYVCLSKQTLGRKQYKERKQILNQISRQSGSEENVVKFMIICELQKQHFIFTSMELYIAYDFILIDLEKQFQNRIIQKRRFTESEINIIMKEVCSGLVTLESTNYKSIRMAYVYFCQYGKQIKVAHPKMFNYLTNLQTIVKNPRQKGIYLSPEELDALQKDQIQSHKLTNEIPNSFTFGMMVLSLMSNRYLTHLYDYRTCEINFHSVHQLLNNMADSFSERLINIVAKLIKPQVHERLTLRSLLNILEQKYELTEHVEITLNKSQINLEINQSCNYAAYRPLFQEEPEEPRHKNYLYGMVYPKIGNQGELYHYCEIDSSKKNQVSNYLQQEGVVIANNRYSYINNGQQSSKYFGDSITRNQIKEKPLREGLGLYVLTDGQSYRGQWKNNQMHGHGKLTYPQGKIRYEGEFQNNKFNGFGTEYSFQQIPERQDEIDKTFVRLNKGSWLKYQGRFKNDKREGPGKVFFKNGIWIGNFKEGQPNGHGIWQGSDGQRLKGIWEDGCYKQSA